MESARWISAESPTLATQLDIATHHYQLSNMYPPFMFVFLALVFVFQLTSQAAWVVNRPHDGRQTKPPTMYSEGKEIKQGDVWPNDAKFRWLRGELEIPATIDGKQVAGECVGLRLNCGDGGEVFMDGRVVARFDNDHPALVIIAKEAQPGMKMVVDVQVYGKVQGADRFGEANLVIVERKRVTEPLVLAVTPNKEIGTVPNGLVGLSQGGGVSDYEDATAAKLKEGGFKWFRMDNVFTQVLKKGTNGQMVYDWKDLDRRIDFMAKAGVDPILAVSYMPQVLDAVPNNDRQSAPKDYAAWEELCFRAAQRCKERGHPVPFWEVWNEVNTGWLKPGPEDIATDAFRKIYSQALGQEATDMEVVRRFAAYCKLYRATVLGVRRADPTARIGGPALASGPFENKERGHCFHGRGFARGLMLWCSQERLPLDFVSWHEYFQPADVFAKEAEEFRRGLAEVPELKQSVRSFMITEWNQAWWADRPQDHEVGAAWAADCITRAFIPHAIDRPCFFYVKQGDMNFRGDYGLLLRDNTPKASFNVMKMFNQLAGRWVKFDGGDGDVSGVAAWDPVKSRLAIVLVNFRDRYNVERPVSLKVDPLPAALQNGMWRLSVVDATHCNAWNDLRKAELTHAGSGKLTQNSFEMRSILSPNSVTLFELIKP